MTNGLYSLRRKKRTATPAPAQPLAESKPVMTPLTGLGKATPAPAIAPDPEASYWKTPVVGKMPLHRFVNIAGSLAQAIAPRTPQGRVGGVLSQFGARAMKEEKEAPARTQAMKLADLRIRQVKKTLEQPTVPTQWGAYYTSKIGKTNPKTNKLYTMDEIQSGFKAAQKMPTKPATHYVKDDKGNISVYQDGKRISGSGKGTTVRDTTGYHYETDDQGRVSVYKSGALISGAGKGKTKRITGAKLSVEKPEKYRKERLKYVNAQMKTWGEDEGEGATVAEKASQKKRISTEYDAEVKGWTQGHSPTTGEVQYRTPDGFIINEFGRKLGKWDPKKKAPKSRTFTEGGTTYHAIPGR